MTRVRLFSEPGSEAQTFLPFRQQASESSDASSERLRCGARCIVAARVRAQRNCQHRLGGCRTQDFRHLHAGERGPIWPSAGDPGRGRGAGGSPPSTWRRPSQSMPMAQRNRSSQASASQAMLTLVCIRVGFNSVRLKAASIVCSRSEILTGFTQCSLTSASRLFAHAITPSTRAQRQSSFHEAKASRCSQGQSRADAAEGLILKPKRTSLIGVGRSCDPATCQAAYDS